MTTAGTAEETGTGEAKAGVAVVTVVGGVARQSGSVGPVVDAGKQRSGAGEQKARLKAAKN